MGHMSGADGRPGLRERKNRRTQQSIVRAAAELTLELGYAGATIPKIAERADVAPRTVSTWFPAKDDILFGTIDLQIARGIDHLRDDDGDLVDRLVIWFADEAGRDRPDAEIAHLLAAAIQHDGALRAEWRRRTERIEREIVDRVARDTGTARDAMGPVLVAGAAMAFILKLGSLSTADLEAAGGDRVVQTGLDFLRAGLASITPAG